jgi:hypothetical protein
MLEVAKFSSKLFYHKRKEYPHQAIGLHVVHYRTTVVERLNLKYHPKETEHSKRMEFQHHELLQQIESTFTLQRPFKSLKVPNSSKISSFACSNLSFFFLAVSKCVPTMRMGDLGAKNLMVFNQDPILNVSSIQPEPTWSCPTQN